MYGTLEEADGRWRLRFTRTLPHPPEKVWRAITESEHLAAWFPARIDGERRAGATLRFVFEEEIAPADEGEMLAYQPHTLLEFRWGSELLRFELEPDGVGTVLTLLDTFDELGKAARDSAGWHVCLDVLAEHLNGERARPTEETQKRWKPLNRYYADHFGPESATIGPPAGYVEAHGDPT